MTKQTRLSLVEVIIIAAVLAVASIGVAPKFSSASAESQTGDLIEGLQTMRSQLALYRVQHQDRLPPTDSLGGFKRAMTTREGRYDPYVRAIPVNPYNGLDTVRFDGEPAGTNEAGWRLDTKAGLFQADNSEACALF